MVLVDGDDVDVENVTLADDDRVMTIDVVMSTAVKQVDPSPMNPTHPLLAYQTLTLIGPPVCNFSPLMLL